MAFPQTGNHEYNETDAQGYFDYFASRFAAIAALPSYSGEAGTVGKGWYGVNINGWHFVSLNSNCPDVGGCEPGSEQESWLAGDLAAHPGVPIIAVWHAPRYTCGGGHTDAQDMQAMWADLHAAHADFVFSGHNHFYQHYKPLNAANPDAVEDDAAGITEIITGSGGVSTYSVCAGDPRIAAQIGGDASIGVMFLTLSSDGSYSFEYQLRSDSSIFDSGSGVAHNAP
jgi:acid phosphatase type 7